MTGEYHYKDITSVISIQESFSEVASVVGYFHSNTEKTNMSRLLSGCLQTARWLPCQFGALFRARIVKFFNTWAAIYDRQDLSLLSSTRKRISGG